MPTPADPLAAALDAQRRAFEADRLPTAAERIRRLDALKGMIKRYGPQLTAALKHDFSARSEIEIALAEFVPSVQHLNYLRRRVRRWMRPERRQLPLHLRPGRAEVRYQPLGVVGIIVPFNYPVLLTVAPLATALAAGNRALIKLPEATPETSALMVEALAATFDTGLVMGLEGNAGTSARFSRLPFDHLLFTGSGRIGREVMHAAAEHLTPVTLELGGKSPALIDEDADLDEAAARICFGKSLNAGQTCIAPDYVLVPRAREAAFLEAYRRAFARFYPALPDNRDYGGIISDSHLERLAALIEDARRGGATIIELGPAPLGGGRRLAPVMITGVAEGMRVMREEIFGPILPVVPYDRLEDATAHVNAQARPLALYFFGRNRSRQRQVLDSTLSGGAAINDTVVQVAADDLPFGGVGASGMGRYHGREGFITMSNARAVLYRPRINPGRLLYPPWNGRLARLALAWLQR